MIAWRTNCFPFLCVWLAQCSSNSESEATKKLVSRPQPYVKRELFFLFLPGNKQKNSNPQSRPCKKHVRFQDENFCDAIHDYSLGKVVRDAKIRRVDGKTADEYDHFHVGGTTLCGEYAKRAMLEAAEITAECDRKRCKYSNNYPTPAPKPMAKRSTRFSSIYV